jgi:hypothetical protein
MVGASSCHRRRATATRVGAMQQCSAGNWRTPAWLGNGRRNARRPSLYLLSLPIADAIAPSVDPAMTPAAAPAAAAPTVVPTAAPAAAVPAPVPAAIPADLIDLRSGDGLSERRRRKREGRSGSHRKREHRGAGQRRQGTSCQFAGHNSFLRYCPYPAKPTRRT